MTIKKSTPKGKSYWNSTGAYKIEYNKLSLELVPAEGVAPTVHGEMLRAISNLTYDFCNNGNCNALDAETETEIYVCNGCGGSGEQFDGDDDMKITCDECFGSGEQEEEVTGKRFITEYFEKMIDFLKANLVDKQPVYDLEKFMLDGSKGYGTYKFDNEEMGVYNKVTDAVIYQILTTENKPNLNFVESK